MSSQEKIEPCEIIGFECRVHRAPRVALCEEWMRRAPSEREKAREAVIEAAKEVSAADDRRASDFGAYIVCMELELEKLAALGDA